jgi:AcrR family transcriptional regulator
MAQSLRDRVIRAAVKYIADSGPEGLSFRQIAADAGVSHQAPYHHFGDRSAIFTEIAREGFQKFTEVMSSPARKDEDANLAVRMCERYVDFALTNKGYFRVMFRSDLCQMDESADRRNPRAGNRNVVGSARARDATHRRSARAEDRQSE